MGILAGTLKWLLVMLIVCGAIVVICYVAQDKEKRGEKNDGADCGSCHGNCQQCEKNKKA